MEKLQKMEFKLILKFYLNLIFNVTFHLKIQLFMKMYSAAALHVNMEEIYFSLHTFPEYFQFKDLFFFNRS